MKQFQLDLDGGGSVSGRLSIPPNTSDNRYLPLLVCLHGGSYDSEYFDASPEYSISRISNALGIPVVAIDRPGYGDTRQPEVPPTPDTSYAQLQGKFVNDKILPRLWQEYGVPSGAAAIVLLSHSIGGMMATVSAGSYKGTEGYPLAGFITSGIGAGLNPKVSSNFKDLVAPDKDFMTFPPAVKDIAMLQLPEKNLADPTVTEFSERLNRPTPIAEFLEINSQWLSYWNKYSHAINVPVMYGISEFDELWASTIDAMERYRDSFPSSPKVEASIIPRAPHCIELSYQSRSWMTKCCGFALECAAWHALSSSKE